MSSSIKGTQYAWYSEKQFEHIILNTERKFPYIYYELMDGSIVQITEITNENKHNFNDAICLGKVKKYVTCTKEPTNFTQNVSSSEP